MKYPNYWIFYSGLIDPTAKREKVAELIKGIGYKEASHFLRNIGYRNLAIIDRHYLKI
jgi:N-glycosylase/DNA lyase